MAFIFFIIGAILFSVIPIAIFLFSDKSSRNRNRRFQCVRCGQHTFLSDKNVCLNCGITSGGESLNEQTIAALTEQAAQERQRKRRTNILLMIFFSVLAVVMLTITLVKLFK